MGYTTNASGNPCFYHSTLRPRPATCDCEYHCTGCRYAYRPWQEDCCSCCTREHNKHTVTE